MKINSKIGQVLFALLAIIGISNGMVIKRNNTSRGSSSRRNNRSSLERRLMDDIQKEKEKNKMLKDLLKKQENVSKAIDEKLQDSSNNQSANENNKVNQNSAQNETSSNISSENNKSRDLSQNKSDDKQKDQNITSTNNKVNTVKESKNAPASDESRKLTQTRDTYRLKSGLDKIVNQNYNNNNNNLNSKYENPFTKFEKLRRLKQNSPVPVNRQRSNVEKWNKGNISTKNSNTSYKGIKTVRVLKTIPKYPKRLQSNSSSSQFASNRIAKNIPTKRVTKTVNWFNVKGPIRISKNAAQNNDKRQLGSKHQIFHPRMKKVVLNNRKAVQKNLINKQSLVKRVQLGSNLKGSFYPNLNQSSQLNQNSQSNHRYLNQNRISTNNKPISQNLNQKIQVNHSKQLKKSISKPAIVKRKLLRRNNPNPRMNDQKNPKRFQKRLNIRKTPQRWNRQNRKLAKTVVKKNKTNKRVLKKNDIKKSDNHSGNATKLDVKSQPKKHYNDDKNEQRA